MNMTQDRLRSIGWAAVLISCLVFTIALTIRVNAVKSEVRLAERKIVELKQENLFLETEFQTRANQQQLRTLNDVEFGYHAPTSQQYLEGERQLAALGKARAADAPAPIRVAQAEAGAGAYPAMVSPLTGAAMAAEVPANGPHKPISADQLDDRLSQVGSAAAAAKPAAKAAKAARE